MMKSFGRRISPFVHGDVSSRTRLANGQQARPRGPSHDSNTPKRNACVNASPSAEPNRLKTKFEAIDVLLQILLHQEELTIKEYTINDSKIKVLVIEDTEF